MALLCQSFFRQMPNALLARYFQRREVIGDLDFTAMKETKPDVLFEAWLVVPDGWRNVIDAEFRDIFGESKKHLPCFGPPEP